MSNETKRSLELLALLVSLALAAAGVAKTYFITPQRVDALERTVQVIEVRAQSDHDIIQRIDERTAQTQRDISEIKGRMK
jgi:hypothetical protein